jgi:hypothetical protein
MRVIFPFSFLLPAIAVHRSFLLEIAKWRTGFQGSDDWDLSDLSVRLTAG